MRHPNPSATGRCSPPACPLQYRFQYVEQRPAERISIALPFGSAIHCAIERYHRSRMDNGVPDSLWQIQDIFTEVLTAGLDQANGPVIYKQQTPNRQAAIDMGRKMLEAFYYGIDMTGFTVIGVELPLRARRLGG